MKNVNELWDNPNVQLGAVEHHAWSSRCCCPGLALSAPSKYSHYLRFSNRSALWKDKIWPCTLKDETPGLDTKFESNIFSYMNMYKPGLSEKLHHGNGYNLCLFYRCCNVKCQPPVCSTLFPLWVCLSIKPGFVFPSHPSTLTLLRWRTKSQ